MVWQKNLLAVIGGFIGRLRFPYLAGLLAGLLALNILIPDPLPFFDELFQMLLAGVTASFKKTPKTQAGPPQD